MVKQLYITKMAEIKPHYLHSWLCVLNYNKPYCNRFSSFQNSSTAVILTITPSVIGKLPDEEVIFTCQSDDESIKPQFRLEQDGAQFYPPRVQVIHPNKMSTLLRLHSLSERQDRLKIICFHGTTESTALLNVLRTCNDIQMSCGSGTECFPSEKACDGKPDCSGAHDERKVLCPGKPFTFLAIV
ncbi:hypothetical protein PHET_11602 [Paragonimus heterotremus]|uniref:Uncharacterized protein n=1 Tax=Paragonimus heterotremus TaxID=100268 RepID=A0A8J4SPV3_9TREM|nr:hypothetical protein PHET_11602 [Paragonimus heterotremus]